MADFPIPREAEYLKPVEFLRALCILTDADCYILRAVNEGTITFLSIAVGEKYGRREWVRETILSVGTIWDTNPVSPLQIKREVIRAIRYVLPVENPIPSEFWRDSMFALYRAWQVANEGL